MTLVRLEPAAPRSRVQHSTTEPLRSRAGFVITEYSESARRLKLLLVILGTNNTLVGLKPSCLTDWILFGNTVNPEQLASLKLSDQDPHCFQLVWILKTHAYN